MNSTSTTILGLTIMAILAAIPRCGYADPVDQAFTPNSQNRVWTVYQEPTDQPHIHKGQRFRIQKQGSNIQLIPLHDLRTAWGLSAGSAIDLEKTTGANKKLCGTLEIHDGDILHDSTSSDPDAHTEHVVVISYEATTDIIAIPVEKRDAAAYPDLEDQCDELIIHGGVAHAEN